MCRSQHQATKTGFHFSLVAHQGDAFPYRRGASRDRCRRCLRFPQRFRSGTLFLRSGFSQAFFLQLLFCPVDFPGAWCLSPLGIHRSQLGSCYWHLFSRSSAFSAEEFMHRSQPLLVLQSRSSLSFVSCPSSHRPSLLNARFYVVQFDFLG
jgi:hypothetical protein